MWGRVQGTALSLVTLCSSQSEKVGVAPGVIAVAEHASVRGTVVKVGAA